MNNLISNALKHTLHGEVSVKFTKYKQSDNTCDVYNTKDLSKIHDNLKSRVTDDTNMPMLHKGTE